MLAASASSDDRERRPWCLLRLRDICLDHCVGSVCRLRRTANEKVIIHHSIIKNVFAISITNRTSERNTARSQHGVQPQAPSRCDSKRDSHGFSDAKIQASRYYVFKTNCMRAHRRGHWNKVPGQQIVKQNQFENQHARLEVPAGRGSANRARNSSNGIHTCCS